MADNYTEAFARYGARLTNRGWSLSAFTPHGDLVVSVWHTELDFDKDARTITYEDVLSRWLGNAGGRAELRSHLTQLKRDGGRLRLVIAHPKTEADRALVGKVQNEAIIPKTFEVRPQLIGTLEEFDGDYLKYVFREGHG